jgi:hypothetical protein
MNKLIMNERIYLCVCVCVWVGGWTDTNFIMVYSFFAKPFNNGN